MFFIRLDYKMKDLLHMVQSFLKDSFSLIKDLKIKQLTESAIVFTADTKSMYTNIIQPLVLQPYKSSYTPMKHIYLQISLKIYSFI
jgi:pyoverdine/dityrosine biosynthesis protein Dit1